MINKRIVICGSMSFAEEMLETKKQLEELDFSVIPPINLERFLRGGEKIEKSQVKIESDVIKRYYDEISTCDAILVVNITKGGIENYIGGNALIEIAFAHVLNKLIFLLNPIPQISYTEEIKAMEPIILQGDLAQITLANW